MFPPSQHKQGQKDADAPIRLTDTDAALARLSAVQKGYLYDPYVKHVVSRAHLQPPRSPLINVGTFVRSAAIDGLVDGWLQLSEHEGQLCQIVSLGAGSDTRFWRIATSPHKDRLAKYIEIDFPEITTKKAMAIRKSKELSAILGNAEIANGGTSLHSSVYSLLPADLRRPPSEALAPLLATSSSVNFPGTSLSNEGPLLSSSLPTLLLFECVLVYMSPGASSALIQWFVDYFFGDTANGGVLGGIVYEMFGLGDAFGRVMLNNLKSRHVSLPGVEPYPSVASLPSRFTDHKFTTAHALTLREIRKSYIYPTELERTSKLEMLDEVEELDLVLQHYAITWGVKLPHADGVPKLKAPWCEWGMRPLGNTMVIQQTDRG